KYQSIPRRNKVNWHFARDDHMFTMIKLVSNTQQYSAILPIKLMNEAIRNSKSYKEYYAIASGAEPPKTKARVRKKQSSYDTTRPLPTNIGKRLKTSAKVDKPAKEKQPAKTSKAKGVLDVPTYEFDDEEISWKSSEEDDDDEVDMSEHDEDVDAKGMNVEGDKMDDEGANEEDDANELYRDVNINLKGRDIQMADVQTTQVIKDTHVTLTPVNPEGQQQSTRNKVNWHFARDDHMFTMIKLVSKHQNTQQYSAILPIKLMNEAIRNSKSYKEYYAIASGAEPPKTKARVRKKQSSYDTTRPLPTNIGKRLKTSAKVDKPAKEKQPAKTSKAKGLTVLSEVALTEAEQMK
nr:hypothetical protein [Tanacetum cinerariifolium]